MASAVTDLDGSRAPDQEWQALQGAAARYEAGADLRLAEDRALSAGEADVAGQGELASAAADPAAYDSDA